MANSAGALLEGTIDKVLAGKLALVLCRLLPVLGDEAESLDGSQLANTGVAMGEGNLDEEQKRLGLRVVILLQVGGDSLDLLCVGCCGILLARCLVAGDLEPGGGGFILTHLTALEQLCELVFVHTVICSAAVVLDQVL